MQDLKIMSKIENAIDEMPVPFISICLDSDYLKKHEETIRDALQLALEIKWNTNMNEAPRDGSPFIGEDSNGETHIAHLFTAPADDDSPETYAFLEYHGSADLDLIKWMHIPKEDE